MSNQNQSRKRHNAEFSHCLILLVGLAIALTYGMEHWGLWHDVGWALAVLHLLLALIEYLKRHPRPDDPDYWHRFVPAR